MVSRFESRWTRDALPILSREFGTAVIYCRGNHVSDEIIARRYDRKHKAIGAEYGIEIRITMRAYILTTSTLLIDGDAIEPKTGDRIIEGEEVFEVQPPDEQTPSAELQAGGFEWIVHTKRVE